MQPHEEPTAAPPRPTPQTHGATRNSARDSHTVRAVPAAFAAGAAAVLTTHQGALWMLHRAGWAPWPAYALTPTAPFGVPAVASAAFWGGVWWVALARALPRDASPGAVLARAALLGAVLPNAVGAVLVAAGHGARASGAARLPALASAIVVNALWAATAALPAVLLAARAARRRHASR